MDEKIKNLKDRKTITSYERQNLDTIVFAESTNKSEPADYWEVFDNSALIMYNLIQPKIGRSTQIKAVLNYYNDSISLRVAYHKKHIENIWRDMKNDCDVKLIRKTKNIKVFKLNEAVIKKQFEKWRKDEEVKVLKRDAVLLNPTIHNPKMSGFVRELGDEIVYVIEKMRGSLRDVFGRKLVDILLEIYEMLRKDEVNVNDFLKTLDGFGFLITILADRTAIDERRSLRIGKIVRNLRKIVDIENADRKANKCKR
jgi:hypothetical protein